MNSLIFLMNLTSFTANLTQVLFQKAGLAGWHIEGETNLRASRSK